MGVNENSSVTPGVLFSLYRLSHSSNYFQVENNIIVSLELFVYTPPTGSPFGLVIYLFYLGIAWKQIIR